MKRKIHLGNLEHDVDPMGSAPNNEMLPIIVAVIIAISAATY